MDHIISKFAGFIWNWPVTLLCLGGCVFFTLALRFIQIRCFPHAISLISGKYDNPNEKGQITHFQALSAALSATIGLGNIAGVAIAIGTAGPGSIFWMWIIGFFGMATKYCECALGTHYREINKNGEAHGGPMYYITKGLGKKFKPLAIFYAIAIGLAAFGAGCLFQSNQAAAALNEYYHIPTLYTGIALFFASFFVIIGGIKRIGQVASKIVPFMCIIYIGCALLICLINIDKLPMVFSIIIKDAFTGYAVAGGFIPVLFAGIRRAIFSNEAGLGSAAIAHAAVKTDYPIREGIVASLGPFIDTIVVCTATAIVILLSGHYGPHMFKPADHYILSFESDVFNQKSNRPWTVLSEKNTPAVSDPFRPLIKGNHVLSISETSANKKPITFHSIPANTGAIRFSYFKTSGDMTIDVYSDAQHLGTLNSFSRFEDKDLSIDFFNVKSEWQSAIIHLPKTVQDSVSLRFTPTGDSVQWYLDAIEPVEKLSGIALTTHAFDTFFKGFGSIFITFAVIFFAFSTMISWSYYGETALYFLFGHKFTTLYKWVFVTLILVGATQTLDVIINFSDAMIGLLVIPNMIAIIFLHKQVRSWTVDYFNKLRAGKITVYK